MRTSSRTLRTSLPAILSLLGLASAMVSEKAEAQETRRVGIAFSQPSAQRFYDEFSYAQLFMSAQHQAMMAGIPFDLLTEDDLTNSTRLEAYSAIIFPQMTFVTRSKYAAIEAALSDAVFSHNVGLLAAGDFMVYDENGAALPGDPYSRLSQLLGIQHDSGVWGTAATLRPATITHPAMSGYVTGEQIIAYDQIWFDTFRPTNSGAIQLVTATSNNISYPGVIATQTGGRNVHFASDQLLGDTDLLWSCLQWVVYGTQPAVALKLGRNSSIFVARNDMDQSMYSDEVDTVTRPLQKLLAKYKADYGFVGSFYLNLGNRPAQGETTNWAISRPIYQGYLALGNEIGTHSWTHPNNTSSLTATQLDYEFRQSAEEINKQLGIKVLGASIPGNPENLQVDRTISPNFQYVSGRSGIVGWGSPGANGWLSPDYSALYLSMSMSPDWTLVGYLNYTVAQAVQIWRDEYTTLTKHGSQPIVHFLWHDYSATGFEGFTTAMYPDTFSWLRSMGTEFATVADTQQRIRTFAATDFRVSGTDPVTVDVLSTDAGRFSSKMHRQANISAVDGWYAYDEDQVFLPKNGGKFVVHFGATPAEVTHITELPMRANLLSVTGDGQSMSFSFEGEGVVKAKVAANSLAGLTVAGADSSVLTGSTLQMTFGSNGVHTVVVTGASVTPTCTDGDKDGAFLEGGSCGPLDCDDADPARYPGATEVLCDGKNNACAATISPDEADADRDLYPVCAGDCNDTNAAVHPGATEICTDGIDNDCNGMTDANDPACAGSLLPIEATFASMAAEDGWLRESNETSGVGGAVTSGGTGSKGLRVGDDASDRQIKSIVSFDTSSLPDTAKVLSATLLLTRGGTEGTDPMLTFGSCLLGIKGSTGFGGSPTLAVADFQAAADLENVGSITSQGGSGTVYTTVLSAAALPYVNRTGRTQLRFAFTLDDNDDRGSDITGFYPAESTSATQRPRLVVKYQP